MRVFASGRFGFGFIIAEHFVAFMTFISSIGTILSIIAHLQWRNAFGVVVAVLVGRHAIHLLFYVGGVVHFRGVAIDFVRAVDAVQIGVADEHLETHA